VRIRSSVVWSAVFVALTSVLMLEAVRAAQQEGPAAGRGRGQFVPIGVPVPPLGDGPFVFDTAEQHKIRVVIVAKGLSHPWSLAFLPEGGMLVTERAARLRIIRNGALDPQPIAGLPEIHARGLGGLMDLALHPKFAENKLVYFAYSKPGEKGATLAVARGHWDGGRAQGRERCLCRRRVAQRDRPCRR
jgi:glucose/arabinose dehydrogenase